MRSISAEDATTRSRIRDAAVELFARDGFTGTSVRAIAEHARVSPALVIHHFGSKERLRHECDQHIVAEIFAKSARLSKDSTSGDLSETIQHWLADIDTHRTAIDYLVRMITAGTELGNQLFDRLIDRTEQFIDEEVGCGRMRPSSDPRMTAVLVTAHSLAPLLLERHIGRALGSTGLNAQLLRRMTIPTLELYTDGLYTDDTYLNAARSALVTTEKRHDNDNNTAKGTAG